VNRSIRRFGDLDVVGDQHDRPAECVKVPK
jgi:hypothetical protein